MSGVKGKKDARFDLLPMDAIWQLAVLYGKNDKASGGKYDERNWEAGYEWSLSYAAALRHIALAMQGEDADSESGMFHEVHAAWHLLTLIAFRLRGLGIDDRTSDRQGLSSMTTKLLNSEIFEYDMFPIPTTGVDKDIYYTYDGSGNIIKPDWFLESCKCSWCSDYRRKSMIND